MPKILITGGCGFIGSHLAESLLAQGNEVFVVDDLSTGKKENIAHLAQNNHFHFTQGSILDEKLMAEQISKVEQVYHLAAVVGVRKVLGKPLDCLLTNIQGTEIVLQEAAKNKAKVLITSTSEVCGKGDKMPFKEEDDRIYGSVYNDRWVYAFSKAIDEFVGLAYWRQKNLSVVVVRLFNVIGPRQTGQYGMVAPTFVRQALKGEKITVFGNGGQQRCFADVADIIDALIKLMNNPEAEGKVLHLGSYKEISINNLAKLVKELAASSSEIQHISYNKAYPEGGYEDFKRRVPDISKVKDFIGFEPKITLEQSIKKIIEYQNQDKKNA